MAESDSWIGARIDQAMSAQPTTGPEVAETIAQLLATKLTVRALRPAELTAMAKTLLGQLEGEASATGLGDAS